MRRPSLLILAIAAAVLGTEAAASRAGVRGDDAPVTQGTQHIEAGPLRVELTLDRTTMNAAESLAATIRVTSPSSVRVELPSPGEKLDGFSVAATVDEPAQAITQAGEWKTVVTRRFTLEPFLPGDYSVPSLEVLWNRVDSGESGIARTAPVAVHVVSLLPGAPQGADADPKSLDPGSIRDAYVAKSGRNWRPLVLGAGAGIGAALLTGWGARTLRRRRGGPDRVSASLARIAAARYSSDRGPVEMCHDLADALHLALSDRVDPAAGSLSTNELASRLALSPSLSRECTMDVQRVLERLDAARFSGDTISLEERDRLVDATLNILRTLRDFPAGGVHPGVRT